MKEEKGIARAGGEGGTPPARGFTALYAANRISLIASLLETAPPIRLVA